MRRQLQGWSRFLSGILKTGILKTEIFRTWIRPIKVGSIAATERIRARREFVRGDSMYLG